MKLAFLACTVLLGCLMIACGDDSIDFINHSPEAVSTQQLRTWWAEAQAAPIDLNYFARFQNPSLPPDLRPPDSRAISVKPRNIDFLIVPNSFGGFICSEAIGQPFCGGETIYSNPIQVKIAQAHDPEVTHSHIVYEFQNVILHKLGYPMDGR